jgi:hypothetical protein
MANRETGVTLHLPSFLRQAIQTARFGLIFRVVWRKGYARRGWRYRKLAAKFHILLFGTNLRRPHLF